MRHWFAALGVVYLLVANSVAQIKVDGSSGPATIGTGVRILQMNTDQASPTFIQGAQGGASQISGYLTPTVTAKTQCQANAATVVTCNVTGQVLGSMNVVVVRWYGATVSMATTNPVVDSKASNYYQVFGTTHSGTAGTSQAMYRSAALASGGNNTITVTFTAATDADISILEIANLDMSWPKDASISTTGAGSAGQIVQTSPITTSYPTELLLLAGTSDYYFTADNDGSLTQYQTIQVSPSYHNLDAKRSTTTGANETQIGKAILTNAGAWILQLVAWRAKSTTTQEAGAAATFTLSQARHHTNIVIVSWRDATHDIFTVTDSAANTYTKMGTTASYTSAGVTLRQAMFYAKDIATYAAGNKVTATFDGDNIPSQPSVQALEYSNLDTTAPLDTAVSKSGSYICSTPCGRPTVATDPVTPATNVELAVSGITGTYGVDSVTATNPATTLRLLASDESYAAADRVFKIRDAYDASFYLQPTSQLWLMQTAYFIAAGQTGERPLPQVYSVSPDSGSTGGSTTVAITGANFRVGATAKFGGTSATGVTVVSPTQITASTPSHVVGGVDVSVTNPDGGQGVLSNGFRYDQLSQGSIAVSFNSVGSGQVTSNPAGISCHSPDGCTGTFNVGTTITLTAQADTNSKFTSWGGPCSGYGGSTSCVLTVNQDISVSATFDFQTYTTNFSNAPENPLSEGHLWVNGGSCGDSALCKNFNSAWPGSSNVQTGGTPARAYNITGCTTGGYNDASAELKGNWSPNQEASAVVYVYPDNITSYLQELELHLRGHMSRTTDAKPQLYENYWRAQGGNDVDIMRWNGDGSWCNLDSAQGSPCGNTSCTGTAQPDLVNGDTIRFRAEGSGPVTLRASLVHNGVETVYRTCTDNDSTKWITEGNPGLGFCSNAAAASHIGEAGLSSFTAQEVGVTPPTSYRVSVEKLGSGTVNSTSPDNQIHCGDACYGDYATGTDLVLQAIPDAGYTFDHWDNCDVPVGDQCTVHVGSAPWTVIANFSSSTGDYYVAPAGATPPGNDSNPGSSTLPWRTIQHAASYAPSGSTIVVRPGTYQERVTISRSNLTFKGTKSGGTYQTIVDPSARVTGTWTLPELGNGVYKLAFPGVTSVNNLMIGTNRRNLERLGDGLAWTGGTDTRATILATGAAATYYNSYARCTLPYWDGVEAAWAWYGGYVYLRFRDGTNPNTLALYATTSSSTYNNDMNGVVNISGSNVTFQDFWLRGSPPYGVRLSGSGTGNLVQGNYIAAQAGIGISGQANLVIDNNFLTNNFYALMGDFDYSSKYDFNGMGPYIYTNPAGQESQNNRSCMQEKSYHVQKHWFGRADDFGDALAFRDLGGASNVEIKNNHSYQVMWHYILGTSANPLSSNWDIHDNFLEYSPTDSVDVQSKIGPLYFHDNKLYHVSMALRFMGLNMSNRVLYYYNNKIWNCGWECIYIFWNTAGAEQEKNYIYNNSFLGYPGYTNTHPRIIVASGNGGTAPNTHFFNNLLSDGTACTSWGGAFNCTSSASFGAFGYNWLGGAYGTMPSFTGASTNMTAGGTYAWTRSLTTEPSWTPPTNTLGQGVNCTAQFTIGSVTLPGMPGCTAAHNIGAAP